MNFLAHLHIAHHCNSSITGNLLGDFVKGNPRGRYPDSIVRGILLHRFVDKYTDNHESMKYAKSLFTEKRRRFAPIAMDLFWDHCLASDWENYSEVSLEDFCSQMREASRPAGTELPERYLHVTGLMWRNHWLLSYREKENIGFALERMSMRSPRMGPLAHCFSDIENNYAELHSLFSALYRDVLEASADFSDP